MKKLSIGLGILLFLFLLYGSLLAVKGKITRDVMRPVKTDVAPSISPTPVVIRDTEEEQSVFIPYWAIPSSQAVIEEDTTVYFGVTPNTSSVNRNEDGYRNLATFLRRTKTKKKILTLRMVDSEVNTFVLSHTNAQKQIAKDIARIAKENGFSGVLLDLELSAIPLDSVITQISSFTKIVSSEVKHEQLSFSIAIYGDTFYRVRPYDIKTIAAVSDSLSIMSYDFHKARGNPGPNFPLRGKERYEYDMEKMVDDFLRFVPGEKLTIVFGLYGYDWIVDEKGKMLEQGNPMTTAQINAFLKKCQTCKVTREALSSESKITYTLNGKHHVIWYEDGSSVEKKKAFLKTKGINSFSYWAYSYY